MVCIRTLDFPTNQLQAKPEVAFAVESSPKLRYRFTTARIFCRYEAARSEVSAHSLAIDGGEASHRCAGKYSECEGFTTEIAEKFIFYHGVVYSRRIDVRLRLSRFAVESSPKLRYRSTTARFFAVTKLLYSEVSAHSLAIDEGEASHRCAGNSLHAMLASQFSEKYNRAHMNLFIFSTSIVCIFLLGWGIYWSIPHEKN